MKKHFLSFIFFAFLVAVMTYPLCLNLTRFMPGFFSTDESYAILWNSWLTHFSLQHGMSLAHTDFISFPQGVQLLGVGVPVGFIWFLINYCLAVLTTPVLTYNLQVIGNLFLSAACMYVLVYWLTRRISAALFSGIAFGFSPYLFVRAWQHLGETYMWPMPLFLWCLLRLKDADTKKTRIWFVLSAVVVTIGFNVCYYVLVITVVFLLYLSLDWKTNKGPIKRILKMCGVAGFVVLPQFYTIIMRFFLKHANEVASAHNVFLRPFEDLFEQSARPLSYLLPAAVHPVFGSFTEQLVGTLWYGRSFTEHTLYLGWSTLFLAFIAMRWWRKPAISEVDSSREDKTRGLTRFFIGYFLLLLAVAWFFSQPPWWQFGKIRLYMPSFFMYKIIPMFRAYCRFGIVVMLAVSALAGFGLVIILQKRTSRISRSITSVFFSALLLFEFWNYPPFRVIDVSEAPSVYYWLKREPANTVIAEYPLDVRAPNELIRLYQIVHEKKMINFAVPGSPYHQVLKQLAKLSLPETAKALKEKGVRYILVHHDGYSKSGLVEDINELNDISRNNLLKLIKKFQPENCKDSSSMCIKNTGPIDVYEIVSR